jgi:hypothetical protein
MTTIKNGYLILRPYNHDKADKLSEVTDPLLKLNSGQHSDPKKIFNGNNVQGISVETGRPIGTKSDYFQNIANFILVLSEGQKGSASTPGKNEFNPRVVLAKLSKDFFDGRVETKHTRAWLQSSDCDLNKKNKENIMRILDGCRKSYKPDPSLDRHQINGLGRLVETELAKLNMSYDTNAHMLAISKSILDQIEPKKIDSVLKKWIDNPPKEYPVARLSELKKKYGDKGVAGIIKQDKDHEGKFDALLFVSFHRFLSQEIDKDFSTKNGWKRRSSVQKENQKKALNSIRGVRPEFETPNDLKGKHAVGLGRRSVSIDFDKNLTSKHTRPIDYKSAKLNQIHKNVIQNDKVLGSGISSTTNIHISGVYQTGLQALKNNPSLDAKSMMQNNEVTMRGYCEMIANTLCLDGGHSHWEVFKAINTIAKKMESDQDKLHAEYSADKREKDYDKVFIKTLKKIATDGMVNDGLDYSEHYAHLEKTKMMDPHCREDAFSHAVVQLRNGRDIAAEDRLNLESERRGRKSVLAT